MLKQSKILLYAAVACAFALAVSAFLQPIILSRQEKNWNEQLTLLTDQSETLIQNSFDEKNNSLIVEQEKIENEISGLLQKDDLKGIFNKILDEKNNIRIQIYNHDKLLAWNSEPVVSDSMLLTLKKKANESFLIRSKQYVFISLYHPIEFVHGNYSLLLNIPVKKFYHLQNLSDDALLLDSLSIKVHSEIHLTYLNTGNYVVDGRMHSFPLLNNHKNKIGIITFSKPSLSAALNRTKEDFKFFQSVLVILLFIVFCAWLIKLHLRNFKTVYKYLIICALVIAARILFFVLEIPASVVQSELTSSSNFSSQFAFGSVRSPIEFFLTSVMFLVIAFSGIVLMNKYFEHEIKPEKSYRFPDVFIIILSLFLVLLLWRGFGATVKSVVMDSTIRYFKEFTLTPPTVVWLMCLNLFLLGLIIFLSTTSLVLLVIKKTFLLFKRNKKYLFVSIFLLIQLLGWIYDLTQAEPQGTNLIRITFVVILFVIAYQLAFKTSGVVYKFILFSIASSVISVSLLTNYNTRLEKESLKNTAYDLVRINTNQIQFIVFQTLISAKANSNLNAVEDYSSLAFELWTQSLLYKEGINSSIEFYNADKKYLGGFTSIQDDVLGGSAKVFDKQNGINIIPLNNVFENKINISGYTLIEPDSGESFFVYIKTLFDEDHFNYSVLPKFFSHEKAGISSALDIDAVRMFDYHDKVLVNSYGDINISKPEEDKIIYAQFDKANEAWAEIILNGEKNLVFVLKQNTVSGEKIIALARPEKRFSWNLSDFFKIFFIHLVIILAILIAGALMKFRVIQNRILSFRVKLVMAFLLVSIIPLFIIAFYIREITDERNEEMLARVLNDKSNQISSYLELYTSQSNVNIDLLFEKASKELNTNFTIYSNFESSYSGYRSFYSAGLLSAQLNPLAFRDLIIQKHNGYSGHEVIESKDFYSSYRMLKLAGKQYVIQVSDLFNQVLLPLSSNEMDIFLFGIFSFVVVLIIMFSTFLSGQISSPIRKLTLATRSVASGDYNIEVNDNSKGEIKELVDGFNLMVSKVNQSQKDIAKFEREEAWREMAKQVAHEIKNPLTPMKLSVQQLMIAYKDKSPKFDSIFEKVTSTVISQIETLKNIASEFSNFARMPGINIERIDLVKNIHEALSLFHDEKIEIVLNCTETEIFINSDKDHLKRTFVNLVRNSLQAKATKIIVEIKLESKSCLITISDNGNGIPDNIVDKIFDENFTTKKSGMGLGLNMAKKFIESIQGMIIVEKTSPGGTTFLINIPVAE